MRVIELSDLKTKVRTEDFTSETDVHLLGSRKTSLPIQKLPDGEVYKETFEEVLGVIQKICKFVDFHIVVSQSFSFLKEIRGSLRVKKSNLVIEGAVIIKMDGSIVTGKDIPADIVTLFGYIDYSTLLPEQNISLEEGVYVDNIRVFKTFGNILEFSGKLIKKEFAGRGDRGVFYLYETTDGSFIGQESSFCPIFGFGSIDARVFPTREDLIEYYGHRAIE